MLTAVRAVAFVAPKQAALKIAIPAGDVKVPATKGRVMANNVEPSRVLARTKARTLTQEELDIVAGGGWKGGSEPTRNCYWDRGQYVCYTTSDSVGMEYDWSF